MNKQDIKKLICLGLCLVLLAVFALAVPGFADRDIAYKNEKAAQQIPNTAEEDVLQQQFTLPVLYVYSYDIEKLIPFWQWTPDGQFPQKCAHPCLL